MSQTTGLTTISEEDIARHQAVAQSMVTRVVVLTKEDGTSSTPLAGTNRRFVSTVSTGGMRRTREVELGKTIQSVRGNDQMLSIPQHALLYRTRRGISVALAVAEAVTFPHHPAHLRRQANSPHQASGTTGRR